MSSPVQHIISENQLTEKIDTRYVFSYGNIPYIEEEIIDYEFHLPIYQTVLVERLAETKKTHDLYFQSCIFKQKVRIEDYPGLLYFHDCLFESFVDFANTNFLNKVRFRRCTFKAEVYFNNTTFQDLADFWRCTFQQKTSFYKTDFLHTTVFSGSTFEEYVLFTYSQIEKLLILRRTNFKKGLDLSLANINGDLKLFDVRLNDFESVDNKPDTVDYEEGIEEKGIIFTANKRETFRLIKHYFLSSNDTVSVQKYSFLESRTHRKEIFYKLRKGQDLRENLGDYALLSANRISNNHRTSYVRGALFTLLVGFLIFYLALISLPEFCVYCEGKGVDIADKSFIAKYFAQFLIPTHPFDYIKDSPNPGWGFYAVDILGRIVVAYGIYQTIQAFRKFR